MALTILPGLTFDTGALIALERGERRMRWVRQRAWERGVLATVPAVVLGEWWRGNGRQRAVLDLVKVEPVTAFLGKLVGEALGALPGATLVDAFVMASAAQRGDVVYTSDFDDLDRLHAHFRGVHKVLRV
jgi:predicted nucleic acid-binding protein